MFNSVGSAWKTAANKVSIVDNPEDSEHKEYHDGPEHRNRPEHRNCPEHRNRLKHLKRSEYQENNVSGGCESM